MPIPIFHDIAAARKTILRRVPFDEAEIPAHVHEGIAARFGEPLSPARAVERVVGDVRARGDVALREWSERLDNARLEQFEVSQQRLEDAAAALAPDLLSAIRLAAEELARFHKHQARTSWADFGPEGTLGQLVVPLQRVGVYVPGGSVPLASSLLHAAIPARVAGVEEIIVCSPPQRGSSEPSEVTLAAAHVAGAKRLFTLGGAQAIAAMAYGTETVPRVDKVVGPGNLFVVLAKRLVYGSVGIESLPGPTETLVVADAHANPRYVAADLLAQAEHVLASAILLTPSNDLAEAVRAEVERQLESLPADSARAAGESVEQRGGIVLVPDMETAIAVANDYAPEHLCLLVEHPWDYVGHIRNAGGIFLGEHSFEVLGDYTAGPSHIMPTDGTARYASPVNVNDFVKVISLVGLNENALARIGPAAMRLAEAEKLFAHAAAVRARLSQQS
jgi:histidinol dehydrogenase